MEMEGDCDNGFEEEEGDLAVGGLVICMLVFGLTVVFANLTRSARLLQRIFQKSIPVPN